MFEQRFLSRFDNKHTMASASGHNADIKNDICRHLHDLLNVHKGSVPIRLDYVMMDMNDAVAYFSEAIGLFEQAICRQIMAFEPRLKHVRVNYIADSEQPNRFLFTISAMLNTSGNAVPVKVMTTIRDDGRVTLLV